MSGGVELRARWPDEDPADLPAALTRPYGPSFAWRARLLWALCAIVSVVSAALLAWLLLSGAVRGVGPLALEVLLLLLAAVFLVTPVGTPAEERSFNLVQSGDGSATAFTVTAVFAHGSRWQVARSASCP